MSKGFDVEMMPSATAARTGERRQANGVVVYVIGATLLCVAILGIIALA